MTPPDAVEDEPPLLCPCGIEAPPPWRERDVPWLKASLFWAIPVAAFGVAAMVWSPKPWVGGLVIAVIVLAVGVAGVACAVRGHRRGCWARRSLWYGVASVGLPVRLVMPGV